MSIRIMEQVFSSDLKPTQRLIMICLADNSNNEGVCFPSINTIVKKSGLSHSTVVDNIKKLEESGHLIKKYRSRRKGGRSSNKYLLFPELNKDVLSEEDMELFEDILTQSPRAGLPPQSSGAGLPKETQSPRAGLQSEPSLNSSNRHLPPYPQKVNEWLEYKKSRKEKLVDATIQKLVKQHDDNPQLFAEMVDHSIASGYQGLFAPRKGVGQQSSQQPEYGSIAWRMQQQAKQQQEIIDV